MTFTFTMWIFTRYLELDKSVRRVLISRFLFALTLNCLLEYELLIMFVLFMRMELLNPVRWLSEVMDWTLYSFQACTFIQLQMLLVTCYGVLLYHQQHMVGPYHGSWQQRLEQQLPLKLCFLSVIMGLSSCSTYFYAGYVDQLMLGVHGQLGADWCFVQYNGVICGITYFLLQHLQPAGVSGIWPLPVVRFTQLISIWPRREHLRQALYTSLMATSVSASFWLQFDREFCCQCHLLGLGVYLNMLLVLQLLLVKRIFGEVMLHQLPLVVVEATYDEYATWLHELQLPLMLTLDLDFPFGLQQQLVKDFHDLMANSEDCEFLQLFQLQDCIPRNPVNWLQLRHVLFKRINRFKKHWKNCVQAMRAATSDQPLQLQCVPEQQLVPASAQPSFAGLRPLVQPDNDGATIKTLWSRRYGYDPPVCQPISPCSQAIWKLICQVRFLQMIRQNLSDPLPAPEHCLCEAHSFVWLLRGLVRICIRSVQLKQCKALYKDMEHIFSLLIELEQLGKSYYDLSHDDEGFPCISPEKLSNLASSSINLLILHYKSHLSLIIKNQQLLETLRNR